MPAILCITADDDRLQLCRSAFDYAITHAPDGSAGLAQYRETQYDIVLFDATCDVNRIVPFFQLKQPPVVIVIVEEHDQAVTALELGAQDCIMTGSRLVDLLRLRVGHWLASRREQSQQQRELNIYSTAVAHDLRQPVTTVLTSLHLIRHFHQKQLEEEDKAPYEVRFQNHVNNIEAAINNLNHTISRARILAQVRSAAPVEFDGVNTNAIVSRVLRDLQFSISQHNATVEVAEDLPSAVGEESWIEAVWFTYIENALEYGGDPPKIYISADTPEPGTVRYHVQDNGTGINLTSPVFPPLQPFYEGRFSGYGLTLVRAVVERMGGSVDVDGNTTGCNFSFTLPRAR